MPDSYRLAGYCSTRDAEATVRALAGLSEADRLHTNVEKLVRAARRMLRAYEEGRLEETSSRPMMEALAPFDGFAGHYGEE